MLPQKLSLKTLSKIPSLILYRLTPHLAFFLERDIAVQFIQTILLVSIQKRKRESMEIQTGPRSLKMLSPPFARDHLSKGPFSPTFKTKRKDHHHTKSCEVCARKSLENALQRLHAVATMQK